MLGRLQRLREALRDGREQGVADLAARFKVSAMTIRRDLAQLEAEGLVLRTHGGAVLSRPSVIEFRFQERGEDRAAAKRAIAREAATLTHAGMAVSLDTGTTTLELARLLAATGDLRVLTSSLAAASVLHARDTVELVLLGGVARKGHPDLYGEITEDNIRRFRVDLAFLGADAVAEDGLFTNSADISRVSRAMIAGARQRVLLVDSRKFSRTGFLRFADWNDLHTVITDAELPAATRQWLAKVVPDLRIVPLA